MKLYFFQKKVIIKNICVPTLPKIFTPITRNTHIFFYLDEGSIWILSLARSKLHLYLVLREDLFCLSTWTLGGVVWSVRWQILYQEMIYVTTLTLLETMMNLISSCLLKQLNTFVLWTSIVVFQQVSTVNSYFFANSFKIQIVNP